MEQAWQTIKTCWTDWNTAPIDPILRLLLSSDGTTVRNFKGLFLRQAGLELVAQHEVAVNEPLSLQLSIPKGEKVLERSVWLTLEAGDGVKKKVLFASSVFPLLRLTPKLNLALQLGEKPLGQIIEEGHLPTFRDFLEVGFLPFPEVAQGLSLPKDTLFWARRYRLWINGTVSAFICEVFSPQLSSFSS